MLCGWRIRLIPMIHQVPEDSRDPKVKAHLTNPAIAGPAILQWLLKGWTKPKPRTTKGDTFMSATPYLKNAWANKDGDGVYWLFVQGWRSESDVSPNGRR